MTRLSRKAFEPICNRHEKPFIGRKLRVAVMVPKGKELNLHPPTFASTEETALEYFIERRASSEVNAKARAHKRSCIPKCTSAVGFFSFMFFPVTATFIQSNGSITKRRLKPFLCFGSSVERTLADEKHESNYSKGPYVLLFTVISLPPQNLRPSIIKARQALIRTISW